MVQSKAQTVDAWMAAVEPDRAGALAEVRRLCRERLTGWEERMQWGMPGYGPADADAVVSFNSQKQYIALYLGATAIDRFADRLAGVDRGKGCLRYRRPDAIDLDVLALMLDEIRARGEKMC